jgi:NitT/TauT family transport system ATP-binding protein
VIEIRDLAMQYGTGSDATVALAGVDLDVHHHEFLSIIGPSGCGKTTLMKIVAGLVRQTGGTVRIDGRVIDSPGPDRAVVFQNFALLPWANVLDNVAFGLEMRGMGKAERRSVAREHIERVGLGGFEDRVPSQLSGGMQQRVGLARALAVNPDILLMDEPFGAVDAQTRQLLQEDLLRLWQEHPKTVVFVTHAMDEAVYLSDRIVVMKPRPGRVARVVDVPLPRPRGPEVRLDPLFAELTTSVWDTLRDSVRQEEEEVSS